MNLHTLLNRLELFPKVQDLYFDSQMKVLVKKENGEKNATVITTTEKDGKTDVTVETVEGDEVDTLIAEHEE